MPVNGCGCSDRYKAERLQEAKRRVAAKFPDLPENSSGWHRALAVQLKKR